jgi:hypothetical protein
VVDVGVSGRGHRRLRGPVRWQGRYPADAPDAPDVKARPADCRAGRLARCTRSPDSPQTRAVAARNRCIVRPAKITSRTTALATMPHGRLQRAAGVPELVKAVYKGELGDRPSARGSWGVAPGQVNTARRESPAVCGGSGVAPGYGKLQRLLALRTAFGGSRGDAAEREWRHERSSTFAARIRSTTAALPHPRLREASRLSPPLPLG